MAYTFVYSTVTLVISCITCIWTFYCKLLEISVFVSLFSASVCFGMLSDHYCVRAYVISSLQTFQITNWCFCYLAGTPKPESDPSGSRQSVGFVLASQIEHVNALAHTETRCCQTSQEGNC